MQPEAIPIRLNGEAARVPANQSVAELLEYLNIHSDRVAVELDKTIVRKRDWAETILGPGAQVEIVEFVGGG